MIVLPDTSVWIAHLRQKNNRLTQLLSEGHVLSHPFIIGELACGNLAKRSVLLQNMSLIPSAEHVSDSEVMHLIETRKLWGRGLGWVDMHLLASALLTRCRLWTLDKALAATASDLGIASSE